jgi:murein DD-endopeptidase MepM/ murein hydrolase activator NlpD
MLDHEERGPGRRICRALFGLAGALVFAAIAAAEPASATPRAGGAPTPPLESAAARSRSALPSHVLASTRALGPLADRSAASREPAVPPVLAPYGRVSSRYGYRWRARQHRRRYHAGMDFVAPLGVMVRSVRPGRVEVVARDGERGTGFGGYGNAVVVRHADEGVWVMYAHLSSVRVRAGQWLRAGEALGRAGRTSNRRFPNMPPHLHFEVRVARPDGSSPFPARYRRFNRNPRCWFAEHGLYYDQSGELAPEPSAIHRRCKG